MNFVLSPAGTPKGGGNLEVLFEDHVLVKRFYALLLRKIIKKIRKIKCLAMFKCAATSILSSCKVASEAQK